MFTWKIAFKMVMMMIIILVMMMMMMMMCVCVCVCCDSVKVHCANLTLNVVKKQRYKHAAVSSR